MALKRKHNSHYNWAQQKAIPDHTEEIMTVLGNGYSKDEAVSWAVNNTDLSVYQAKCVVSAVWENLVSHSGDEAIDVYRTIKVGLMNVLKTASHMYETATTRSDESDALKIKLRALAQMRDLLPRQIQIENLNEETDNTRRLLFEVHGIDPDTVLEEEEED